MRDKLIMREKERRRKSILDGVKEGQLTQQAAAKRLGLSYRQTKRIYQRYIKEGDAGLVHKSRGQPSTRCYSAKKKQAILALYQEKYWDFGPTLAAEKLLAEDGYKLHPETLRLWLKCAGLWQAKRRRKAHRSRRARRLRFGELLQLDGSHHAWLAETTQKQCLMNLVDDATSKTLALLDTGETTEGAFRLLKWWIKLHGLPQAIYVDLKSLYISPKSLRVDDEGEAVEPEWLTHFSRACKVLGIEVIKAYSPQAKGRVERSHGVYQDRLVKELRLKGIKTLAEANKLLREGFIDSLNEKFMKSPQSEEDAHIALRPGQDLTPIFCWEYTRALSNDWLIRFENQLLQIPKAQPLRPKQKVTVKKQLDGKLTLWSKGQAISYQFITEPAQTAKKVSRPYSTAQRSEQARKSKSKTPWSQFNPGWLKKTKENPQAMTC